MKLAVPICLVCLLLTAIGASAGVTGTTDPTLFPNTVDWCAQAAFSCSGDIPTTPQPFTSAYGTQGQVGLVFTGQNFQVLQEGSSHFGGSFPDGMGLIYTGVTTLGNFPDAIGVVFAGPQWGVGAYIQPYWYGSFTAEIVLFGTGGSLGTYVVSGNSTDQPSDLLFIGARDSSRDVTAALFYTTMGSGHDGDFEIGTLGLATPEPASIVLMAPSVLGLFGIVRYRRSRKSQEVL